MKKSCNIFTFKSSFFNTKNSKEYYINENNFGDDLILWIAKELSGKSGFEIVKGKEFPTQEDFGWCVNFTFEKRLYSLIIGSRLDENQEVEWVGWIEKKNNVFQVLMGSRKNLIEKTTLLRISEILKVSEKINNIKWYYKEDFDRGIEINYLSEPEN